MSSPENVLNPVMHVGVIYLIRCIFKRGPWCHLGNNFKTIHALWYILSAISRMAFKRCHHLDIFFNSCMRFCFYALYQLFKIVCLRRRSEVSTRKQRLDPSMRVLVSYLLFAILISFIPELLFGIIHAVWCILYLSLLFFHCVFVYLILTIIFHHFKKKFSELGERVIVTSETHGYAYRYNVLN